MYRQRKTGREGEVDRHRVGMGWTALERGSL